MLLGRVSELCEEKDGDGMLTSYDEELGEVCPSHLDKLRLMRNIGG